MGTRLLGVMLIGLVSGCGGGAVDLVVLDGGPDGLGDVVAAQDQMVAADEGSVADGLLSDELGPELPGDSLGGEVGPAPGEAGYPCSGSDDCSSGYCIQTSQGMQCTTYCIEECPFGWVCNQFSGAGADVVFFCVPPFLNLCRPCMKGFECWPNQEAFGAACLDYGAAGNFCGAWCEVEGDCPAGYECQEATSVSGATSLRCVLVEGECPCAQRFADEGAWTECQEENEWGICVGTRACLASGLESCSASIPAPESCNGLDDDCDESVDEETGGDPCLVENESGLCPGLLTCVDGELQCEGEEAEPEACDGVDNNCNGTTDEGFEDTDKDGIADCMENDKDGDDVVDGQDNCPGIPNQDQADHDFDNFGDVCDADDDNDEVPDVDDCAPLDKTINPAAAEVCDGLDNDCDLLVDEGFQDTDADSWKDCVDEDDDNDLSLDEADCAPLNKEIHPAALELCDGVDNNCDEVVDEEFGDKDKDGLADCVDEDLDGDGIANGEDNCPGVVNEGQEDGDEDGIGDLCDLDVDGDGVPDGLDNCPEFFNPGQSDVDGDQDGDLCDDDDDGDELVDGEDNCPLVSNPGQEDGDGDGLGDACAGDDDGDGTPDEEDCAPLNPQIHPAAEDICDGLDNDCDNIIDETYPDTDLDGFKDCVDDDDDGDGSADVDDCAPLNGAVSPLSKESCNSIDDDCNGKIDDQLGKEICGVGECLHAISSCEEGVPQFCNPFQGAAAEFCDGLDNNCDGQIDEALGSTSCGLGNCLHTVENCIAGEPQECGPKLGAEEEVCDGVDNDCDGLVDEGLGVLSCGQGQCQQLLQLCVDGQETACDPLKGAADEFCDGKDNDCDGFIDEELEEQICGQGECLHSVPGCVGGEVPICDLMEGAVEEACNGKDSDCDGVVDDDLGVLTCGLGECQEVLPVCVAGELTICDPFSGAVDEVCDGRDNDCNGVVDDGLPDVTCGLGVCEHTVAGCVDGQANECDPFAGASEEICDGLDNDCDGSVDPADSTDCTTYYVDVDKDDFGVAEGAACLCEPLAPNTATKAGDCDDDNKSVHPEMAEVCANQFDDNCVDGANESCIYVSCKELLAYNPATGTGQHVLDPDGDGPKPEVTVFCEMEMAAGGWMRIANVDTAASSNCPGAWTYDGGAKVCRRPGSNCHSATLSVSGIEWSEVRGRALAYQWSSMDAFHMYNPFGLDGPYVDGISITHGSPRKHIWTYAVGISQDGDYPDYNCPCSKYPGGGPPGFVGANYYCESGSSGDWTSTWYSGDTLYDGEGCPAGNNCCADDSLPWFQRDLGDVTSEDIDARLCSDQDPGNEDIGVTRFEMYVR
jgi:hypothetical protein